jgi:FlaA1/EpsC-like NDP-sugar epimerase
MGSRGSVIPFFISMKGKGKLPITDYKMTRFMITLEEGVDLVWHAFNDMQGGEIYVKKIPSMYVTDLAKTIEPKAELEEVGIRPGEKLHEQMIGIEDSPYTYEYDEYFKILPQINSWDTDTNRIKDGRRVSEDFEYNSLNNSEWMSSDEISNWLKENKNKIGMI